MISEENKIKVDAFLKVKTSPFMIGTLLGFIGVKLDKDELDSYIKTKVPTYKPGNFL